MGGGAKPPKESDSQRKLAEAQAAELERQKKEAENAKPLEIPKAPKILPTPPPPSQMSSDAVDAAEEARRKAGQRTNSARGTLFAGETGGFKGPLGGKQTLLG
jgi:acetylornithine deacetylase/succinyl-diaminopimelate desuccinylase-like protein